MSDMLNTENRAGATLRQLRELAGLTLAEAATIARTSSSYLSKVETGAERAAPTYFARVTAALADQLNAAAVEPVARLRNG